MIRIKRIFVVFMGVLITIPLLVLAEFVLQSQVGLGDPVVYDSHPLWGYVPKPNATYSRSAGNLVTINDVGTRGKSDWRADGRNILFLGDSVTWGGSNIDDEDTFVSLICNQLQDWSCHNAGVNAYGILNMVARSRYDDRIKNAPYRIFIFLTGDFDRGLQKADTAHFILRSPPKLFPALWEISNFVAAKITLKRWFGKSERNTYRSAGFEEQQSLSRRFALDIFIDELERLEKVDQEFLLVHSPSQTELMSPSLLDENQILAAFRQTYPNQFIQLGEAFRGPYADGTPGLFYDIVHYEEAGHRLVANTLAPRIARWLKAN